jgi:AraC-like DNA-binding protein
MIFRTHCPAFPLNDFIDAIFYFEGLTPAHTLDRFLPDGNTELLLDLTDRPQHIYNNDTLDVIQSCRHAWVSGVRTRPITIPSGKGSRMVVVAFKKGGGRPFYPFPMSELTDSVVPAELVFGSSICELRGQLLAAGSYDEMFRRMEQFLLRRAGDRLHDTSARRCIEYILKGILDQPNHLKLQSLVDGIGYSQKHIIDLFKGQVGVTPKQYLRIIRFQKTIQEMERTASSFDWSGLALQSGFYDQAHFIHDFRDFSGFTPGEYLRRKADTLNYVPVL